MKGRVPMDYHQDVQIPPSSSSARMQVPQTYALKSNSSAGYHPNANMRGYNSNSQMTTHMATMGYAKKAQVNYQEKLYQGEIDYNNQVSHDYEPQISSNTLGQRRMTASAYSSMIDPSTSSFGYDDSQMQLSRPQSKQQVFDKRMLMQMNNLPQNINQPSRTFYSQRPNETSTNKIQLSNFRSFEAKEDDFDRGSLGSPRNPFSQNLLQNQETSQQNQYQTFDNMETIKSPPHPPVASNNLKIETEPETVERKVAPKSKIMKNESRTSIPLINLNQLHESSKQIENVVNIDEIPIQTKKLTFEELLAKELENNTEQARETVSKPIAKPEIKRKTPTPKETQPSETALRTKFKTPGDDGYSKEQNTEAQSKAKSKKYEYLKRKTKTDTVKPKQPQSAASKKYSYYLDNFDKKDYKEDSPPQAEIPKPKAKETAKEIQQAQTTKKFLERGKGIGGGKGATQTAPSDTKAIKVNEKVVTKVQETKFKVNSVPQQNKASSIDQDCDKWIQNCKEYLEPDSDEDLSDADSGSDIEIDVFQKLPLPLRGAINREIEKKRNDKRELKRDKEELSRWKNKINHLIEDIETVVKDRINRFQSDKESFEVYRSTEQERLKNRQNESRTSYDVSNLKREIEKMERVIKDKEDHAVDKAKTKNKLLINNQNSL